MSHISLSTSAGLISGLTLVASVFVLLYLANYAVILYYQRRAGKIRADWWISSIFYVGVALLALGNLLNSMHACLAGICAENFFDIFLLSSFLLFIYGFRRRAAFSSKIGVELEQYNKFLNQQKQKGKK